MKRWRTPLAGLIVILWLIFYAFLVMLVAENLIHVSAWLIWPFYLIAGIVWVFPCAYIFKWSSKDPGNEVSNRKAEELFRE